MLNLPSFLDLSNSQTSTPKAYTSIVSLLFALISRLLTSLSSMALLYLLDLDLFKKSLVISLNLHKYSIPPSFQLPSLATYIEELHTLLWETCAVSCKKHNAFKMECKPIHICSSFNEGNTCAKGLTSSTAK